MITIPYWLLCCGGKRDFKYILDWVLFCTGSKMKRTQVLPWVTAPTNGAAGVIPAVLQYYVAFCNGNSDEKIIQFLLTASEAGSIFKKELLYQPQMGGVPAEIGGQCHGSSSSTERIRVVDNGKH